VIVNPIAILRRIIGLGALVGMGIVGAKSWLDEQRAELRRDYYYAQWQIAEDVSYSGCTPRVAMEKAALERDWTFAAEGKPNWCHSAPGVQSYVRFFPNPGVPWISKEDGWIAAFDAQGCRIKIDTSGSCD
jgi:hypothetical protein